MNNIEFTQVRRPRRMNAAGGLRVGGTSAPSFGDDL